MYRLISLIFILFVLSGCQIIRTVGSLFNSTNTSVNSFSNSEIDNLLRSANRFQGIPYKSGGVNEDGMDCSGLLYRIYTDNNFIIPRSTIQQAHFGLSIPLDKIQVGDWLFFRTNGSANINHIGFVIQTKGDRDVLFVHSSTSKGVRSDQLYANYWFKAFYKAIRPFKNISN